MHARRSLASVVGSITVAAALLPACGGSLGSGGSAQVAYSGGGGASGGSYEARSSGAAPIAMTESTSTGSAAGGYNAPASAPSVASVGGGGGGYEYAPPSEPNPATRPGLATEWGERRYDPLSYAGFVRGSITPWASTTIHYNDAAGAVAQASYRAGAYAPVMYQGGGSYGDSGGVRVALHDENGAPLPGQIVGDALYVIGAHGQHYTISLVNQTPLRLEAVVSVDGLDVIDGHAADLTHRGYILDPYGHLDIEGFRESESTIAAFRFGTVADSYAAQTGSARNVGVVGVALFTEAGATIPAFVPSGEVYLRESANPFPGGNGFAPPPPRRYYW